MERLQKVMAHAGVASRRKSEEMISQGRVKVNGETVTEQGIKVAASDEIEVDGQVVEREEKVYFLFHKPQAVITSMEDEHQRVTVSDYFLEVEERVYPVGRLDYDTTGLLIMTNDGDLANKMMHPSYQVEKTYLAHVLGQVTESALDQLEQGLQLEDGLTAPAQAELVQTWTKPARSLVRLTIHEGRNHQVKRMMEAVGHSVTKLHRESYGPLHLEGLAEGDYRPLTPSEIEKLRSI